MKAFLRDIILRPSCYACKAKGCSSQSDLTIADFWGIHTVFPEMDDDKGTGLLFINTLKGQEALDFTRIKVRETSYDRIKPLNPSCDRSVAPHPKRETFFARLGKENLIDLIDDCTKLTKKQRVRLYLNRCKSLIKSVIKRIGGGEIKPLKRIATNDTAIYVIPENPKIVSVCFRNKDNGWKGYNMEIRID